MYKYDVKSEKADEFINHEEILASLEYGRANKHNRELIKAAIEKAKEVKGLSHREAFLLLSSEEEDLNEEVYKLANDIKRKFYGNRPIEYILESIKTIYSVHHKSGDIRRVNVNIAATSIENYKKLKDVGIGTYILFQETYHRKNYEALHPTGPKHDYAYHTEAMDRAQLGGIDDVGCGVLFGLNNYEYDFVGLLMHAEHLEARFGVGPHTISVPRIRPADDIDPETFENAISDDIFKKIVACIRVSVPYTGMIISTRESIDTRAKVIDFGISQISGGSKTSVGGYATEEVAAAADTEQFFTSDQRTLDEVVSWLMDTGHIPSFCTACYRAGRTGDRFMSLVKAGQIGNICQPNALMTLKEYLMDYASPETRKKGEALIEKEIENISRDDIKELVRANLKKIEEGERDFRL